MLDNKLIFNKVLICDKHQLLKHREDIFLLFEKSFNAKIDADLWDWAYIHNRVGDPIVSLYYHEDELIGHYAIIPMKFKLNGKSILAALSMTTMVDSNYRRHGVFVQQANEVNSKAQELGFSLVYGFPNSNSAPGFKKRIGWVVDDSHSKVIKVKGKSLINKETNLKDIISFDYNNHEFLEWRLSKPNQQYIKKGSLILKKFGDDYDIVFHNFDFSNLDANQNYNILVNDPNNELVGEYEKAFDYIFGYKLFDSQLNEFIFKRDLIMSDVF